MIQHGRPDTSSSDIVADGLGEKPRNILVRFFRQKAQVFPDLRFDLGTDLDCAHFSRIVDMS